MVGFFLFFKKLSKKWYFNKASVTTYVFYIYIRYIININNNNEKWKYLYVLQLYIFYQPVFCNGNILVFFFLHYWINILPTWKFTCIRSTKHNRSRSYAAPTHLIYIYDCLKIWKPIRYFMRYNAQYITLLWCICCPFIRIKTFSI